MSTDLVRAAGVVEALSAAWTVFNLYPDPTSQPAFHRVAEMLREALADGEVSLEIGPGAFHVGVDEIEVEREAADRLAKRCFIHNIEVLAVSGRPSDRDIVKFLGVLARDEQDLSEVGGVAAALVKEGASCFTVVARLLLNTAAEEETVERDGRVRQVILEGADPEEFARSLEVRAGGDPVALAEIFHREYREVFERVDSTDVNGREEVVKAFVEAFFYCDQSGQVAVLERFLKGQEDRIDRVFLDQFAGNELARLAPQLDSRGFSLLLDYARIATDQTDKRPVELLGLLESPEPVRTARELVAARVQERLSDVDRADEDQEAVGVLQSQFPDPRKYFYDTLDTFRGLLSVEERDDRFRRLMRVLTGKIGGSIRRGRYRRAELWLRAAVDHPTFDGRRVDEVEEAIHLAGTADVLDVLVGEVATSDEPGPARRLLARLGASRIDTLIDMMAGEEDRARRKVLLDVVGREARRDPSAVMARLDDSRWFVVRNLAVILGRTGNPAAAPALDGLLGHEDHRVRVEALRALSVLQSTELGYFEKTLADPHDAVRQAAVALLGARPGVEADAMLVSALWSPGLDTEEKERVIRVLGDRDSDAARAALDQMAGRRFALSGKARHLRRTAREVLGT